LERQDFATFLPLHWKTVRHARKFQTSKAPFFPRYLFVRLDLERQRWRAVNSTLGVSSLIMEGELPKPVPVGVVEALLDLAEGDGLLAFGQALRPGQKVRVISGPFADRVGELAALDERDRVKVLLDVMGGPIPIKTSSRALAPVE
jgi:transcriptional antiterminator RfaH